ncbi:TRAP-type mannitol/chloroaromatic compound transport system, small permease component [Poseidonocella pacifica]|uniref:TRAP transporter small permease protein n=1 Tax=Poseidonocella pacifica TaxID=871651 RepID=A0A1I0VU86_9RHOB|nr:TRAP transporter small permease [Poseidonocella pacifica]SFA79758.1 TRAP-type mannitol/chloroaromatic compound transport system, small permease component [Poseidonocella pacifica]
MAGSASVIEDGSRLSRLDQMLLRVERALALVSGLAVFMIMVFAVVSVSGRNFFNAPVPGYVDWIEQLMPFIAILGISYTQRDGTHIRMDMIVGALRGRALWAAEAITVFVMLVLMVLLIWGTWAHFQRSFDFAAPLWSRDSSIDIALPLWPAKLAVPLAFSVLALRLLIQLWGYSRACWLGLYHPAAVPLIRSTAQIAAEEANAIGQERSR